MKCCFYEISQKFKKKNNITRNKSNKEMIRKICCAVYMGKMYGKAIRLILQKTAIGHARR